MQVPSSAATHMVLAALHSIWSQDNTLSQLRIAAPFDILPVPKLDDLPRALSSVISELEWAVINSDRIT